MKKIMKIVKQVIKEQEESLVHLILHYSTGEEDYGYEDYNSNQYVKGVLMAKVPTSKFMEIMGQDPNDVEEIEIYDSKGLGLVRYMEDNYDVSVNTRTKEPMNPDIQDGWTQGVIQVIPSDYYDMTLRRYK